LLLTYLHAQWLIGQSSHLMMALWRRGFSKGVLFHSDRGSHCCSHIYQNMRDYYGLTCSMSRKGNCCDNGVAESFFHTLKVELAHSKTYRTGEETKLKKYF